MSDTRPLDDHELESVETVAGLHRKHDESASRLQRGIDGFIDAIGRPWMAIVLVITILAGVVASAIQSEGRMDGTWALWFHLAATLSALLLSIVILASQRRGDAFAARRSAIILDLALLADRKNAKIVSLLEELRLGGTGKGRAPDPESEEMSTPIDPDALAEAIEDSVDGVHR